MNSSPRHKIKPCSSRLPSQGRGDRFASRQPGSSSARLSGLVLPEAFAAAGLGANRVAALSAPRATASGPREAEARPAEEGAGARRAPFSRVLPHRSRDRPVGARGAGCPEHGLPGARRCEGRPGPGWRTRPARGAGWRARGSGANTRAHAPGGAFSEAALPRPDGERQCLPAQRSLAPRLPPRRLLLLGTASPSAAPGRAAAAAGPAEPLCVQPGEGRRRNHLTEARALDAPSARMRRR